MLLSAATTWCWAAMHTTIIQVWVCWYAFKHAPFAQTKTRIMIADFP